MKTLLTMTFALLAVVAWQQAEQKTEWRDLATRQLALIERQNGQLRTAEAVLRVVLGAQWDRSQEVQTTPVTVACYSSRRIETDDTPWTTADQSPVRPGIIAVSRDLLHELGLRMGQRVVIEGYGAFEVRDVMNKKWKRRVDIWVADATAARKHGITTAKLVWQG